MADGGKKKAAASAAAKVKPVVGDFRGIELSLPPKLPGVLALDLAELSNSEGDVSAQLGILWRTLKAVLGDDLYKVRDKFAEDGDGFEDLGSFIEEVVESITKPYSLTPGESSASGKP